MRKEATVKPYILGVEEAAGKVLETIQRRLPHAGVEYESFGGTHYFYINHAGARLSIRFPEFSLQRKRMADLEPAIHEIAQYLMATATPGRLRQFECMLMLTFAENAEPSIRALSGEPTMPLSSAMTIGREAAHVTSSD